jgi:hypothetical protein
MRAPVWSQVPLVEAIKLLALRREQQRCWIDYHKLRPDQQSCATMEEYLIWVALLHR